jgi:hypothetical protein
MTAGSYNCSDPSFFATQDGAVSEILSSKAGMLHYQTDNFTRVHKFSRYNELEHATRNLQQQTFMEKSQYRMRECHLRPHKSRCMEKRNDVREKGGP